MTNAQVNVAEWSAQFNIGTIVKVNGIFYICREAIAIGVDIKNSNCNNSSPYHFIPVEDYEELDIGTFSQLDIDFFTKTLELRIITQQTLQFKIYQLDKIISYSPIYLKKHHPTNSNKLYLLQHLNKNNEKQKQRAQKIVDDSVGTLQTKIGKFQRPYMQRRCTKNEHDVKIDMSLGIFQEFLKKTNAVVRYANKNGTSCSDEISVSSKCTNGHILVGVNVQKEDKKIGWHFNCDGCGREQERGSGDLFDIYSCRCCNFDLCSSCIQFRVPWIWDEDRRRCSTTKVEVQHHRQLYGQVIKRLNMVNSSAGFGTLYYPAITTLEFDKKFCILKVLFRTAKDKQEESSDSSSGESSSGESSSGESSDDCSVDEFPAGDCSADESPALVIVQVNMHD